ncbi:hypothetical protein F4804DRAFT_329399 [Jackrogersella minutella]|nr:hypothetical protein F4804DRAFT_329399 [Jackrogersella minutella]
MAQGYSSRDKVDHPKEHFGDWEALSIHEADSRNSDDNSSQSRVEEDDHIRSSLETDGFSSIPDTRQDLSGLSATSGPKESLVQLEDGNQKLDGNELTKKSQAAESPQGHPPSSTSGSAAFSLIESSARDLSPKSSSSPVSATGTDISKPVVRFSDRGPPRAFTKRPAISRRSSANAVPAATEWGVLFDERGYATLRNGQFLRGLARHVIDDLAPNSSNLVITPEKLNVLYSRYKVDPEVYPFVDIFNSRARDVHDRIADFFTDLNCQYHLVQLDSYSRPRVPALTPVGFAQYLTTCILAHPDEEFRRLDKIVTEVQLVADVSSATDGQPEKLPRQLLRSQFPVRHDPKSRKVLAAALDDLMYDIRLLEPCSPKKQLAIMPPPPPPLSPPSSEKRGSGSVTGVRHYVPAEKLYARKDAFVIPAGPEVNKLRGRYVPTGVLHTIGDENPSSAPASAADAQVHDRDGRRNSYHERPRSRFTEEPDSHEIASISAAREQQHRSEADLHPPSSRSTASPRTSQRGPLSITTAARAARVLSYPNSTLSSSSTSAYHPTGTRTGASSPTYRRAQSPPLRNYRASAPDVSHTPAQHAKPAEYTVNDSGPDASPRDRRGSGGGLADARGSSKAPTPITTTTTTALVSQQPLASARQDIMRRAAATAPPSTTAALMNTGEKKHHGHHRRRRSAVVAVDDDRGPTWEEVLKAQPAHHHGSRNSSKGGGHHRRHHSGY